jgi:pimeloyl-ACP methyl ester carboxylesterase
MDLTSAGIKLGLRSLALAVLIYAGLVAVLFVTQRSLIFQPTKSPTEELARLAREQFFLPWTNSVGLRIGWWRPPPDGIGEGTVLITHGNAGTAVGRDYLAAPIQAANAWDVFILDYPGYADRPGAPTETSLFAAAKEAFVSLTNRPGPMFLVGESLGAGVAACLAGEFPRRVNAACLLVPFNNLAAAAGAHYPWLPVRWLLRDQFQSDQCLTHFQGRVAVVVGGADSVVPPELGRSLFRGYTGGPKQIWDFPGQEHWEAISQPAPVWREITDFLCDRNPLAPAERRVPSK